MTDRLSLARPLDPPSVPVAEMVSTTRREEARSAMAAVAALRERDIPVRNIAVVARDLDGYEDPLLRAAIQHGVTPVFWTQLRVTRTRPYALIESLCDALTGEIDKRTLMRPLEHRWTPGDGDISRWPIEPATVQETITDLPDGERSLDDWREIVTTTPEVDHRITAFVQWLSEVPDPSPDVIRSVLDEVVDRYAECGLPETKATDSPALLNTEIDARAVVRVRTLVQQLPHKFEDRLDEGTVEQSWSDVAELANTIATQRPGRREHSNARAVDIMEANDVWALDIPYVIAVGLTATEWPQETASPVQPELQEAVLQGDGAAAKLAPDASWTDSRDRDHFVDTLRAAANGVIVTRHTESSSGDAVAPSPFLEFLETESIPDDERRQLRSTARVLPTAIRTMLTDTMETETDD